MPELAAKIVQAANRQHHARDGLIEIAEAIVAGSCAADAASLAWAILIVVAKAQARQPPTRRLTWRPSQLRRRG